MSFHFSFVARSIADARAKLAEQRLPAVVAALIDKAIDAIPVPKPDEAPKLMVAQAGLVEQQFKQAGVGAGIATSGCSGAAPKNARPYQTGFFGVSVEACGHIASVGDEYPLSRIDKIDVRPLVA